MTEWDNKLLAQKLADNPDLGIANLPNKSATGKARQGIIPALSRHPHKYHVAPASDRTYNGRVYPSKKQASMASALDLQMKAGMVHFYLEEVKFPLPGGTHHRVDFMVFYPDGTWELVEVKGKDLPMGKLKRKQVCELYRVKVRVV